jgi:hypothetical protein
MTSALRSVLCALALIASATAVSAQSTEPLEPLTGTVWGTLGFQGDVAGAVNTSGVGLVSARRAEIDANTWGERYDTALSFSVGTAFNVTTRSQVFADLTWDQAEERLQGITVSLSGPSFTAADVPFYDDSWILGGRVGGGFLIDLNARINWLTTIDIKYSGPLSDQSGIGTVGFERINNKGNRWTLPVMTGIGFKF